MRLVINGVTLAVASALCRAPLAAQEQVCRSPSSADAGALRQYLLRLTSGDTSLASTRTSYELPLVKASEVRVVTDEALCQRAAQAYHRAVLGDTVPARARSVVVVQVGRTRYVVLDPEEHAGEYEVTAIFDASWRYLTGFLS